MENLGLEFWLTAILEIIILICFFVLCSNVSKIKKVLTPGGTVSSPQTVFAMYVAAGDTEKAKAVLMEIILADADVQACINRNGEVLGNVLARYNRQMKEIGLEIDPEKAYSVKKLF